MTQTEQELKKLSTESVSMLLGRIIGRAKNNRDNRAETIVRALSYKLEQLQVPMI